MRRTSWIDHRINDGVAMVWFLPWFGGWFFLTAADWRDGGSPPSWRRRASPWKRGDANHPGSALVVIESELILRGFKTILDGPPMAFDRDQRFNRCSRWTPGSEEGEIAIGDATTDQ